MENSSRKRNTRAVLDHHAAGMARQNKGADILARPGPKIANAETRSPDHSSAH
jgi:hypothetical protein